jgi:hypothetical protein
MDKVRERFAGVRSTSPAILAAAASIAVNEIVKSSS